MKELLSLIEKKLGYTLQNERKHSIPTLEDIPEDLIQDARKLNTPMLAEIFLRFYVKPECTKYIKVFIEKKVLKYDGKNKIKRL
jgi:hypothetical protein